MEVRMLVTFGEKGDPMPSLGQCGLQGVNDILSLDLDSGYLSVFS